MPATLLLRLTGPMQAWGTQSRFTDRDTGREPSKSGVIGLLCAALGKPRLDVPDSSGPSLTQLNELLLGVRADREGFIMTDYHTAGGGAWPGLKKYGVYKASGAPAETVVSHRHYLSDADFLVGLEGPRALLEELNRALAHPVWQLCLGRRSFVPGLPVRLPDTPPLGPGLREQVLEEALATYPCCRRPGEEAPELLRTVIEVRDTTTNEVRNDVPLSFETRDFAIRYVQTDWIPTPKEEAPCISPV